MAPSIGTQAKDQLFKLGTSVHRLIFTKSEGRVFGNAGGMPVVMLTTTGRKSGAPRQTMLTVPLESDGEVYLVASFGGDDRNPAWFLNLRDDPSVALTWKGRTEDRVARILSADEKAAVWKQIVGSYKGYSGYQNRTEREIPVVALGLR